MRIPRSARNDNLSVGTMRIPRFTRNDNGYSRAIRSRRTLFHVALHFRPAMASRQDHPMRSSRLLGPVRTSCLAVTLASTVSLPLAAQGGGAQQGDSTRTNRVQWDV